MASLQATVRGAAVAATLGCAPLAAGAQPRSAVLVGLVRDSAGQPIPGAELRLKGASGVAARSDDAGGFRIAGLPPGPATLAVRRMGFAPTTADVQLQAGRTDSLVLALTPIAVGLPGVVVEDEAMARSKRLLAGFWERRSRGFGYFITRQDIERREPHEFVDLARLVPSLTVQTRGGRKTLRFSRSLGPRDCPPQYFVDGIGIERGEPDEFSPEDVEAVEIYAGPASTPPQFTPRPFSYTCGAVVIWTRLPGGG